MPARVDDTSISHDDVLWRRVLPEWTKFEEGATRVTSVAFKDRHTGEVSVHIARLANLEAILAAYPGHAVVAITAGFVRSLGNYIIACNPIMNDPRAPDDPSHAVICPSPTKSDARALARHATWVKEFT